MKNLFYFVSLFPKSFFVALVDLYLFLKIYKYFSSYKVTIANIKIAYPKRNNSDLELLSKLSIRESIISGFESIYTWGRNEHEVNKNILRIENNFLVNNLKDNGLICVSFHNRSVDMLLSWMNSKHTTHSLYKKVKNKALNNFIKDRRESGLSKCYETTIAGVRHIFSALKNKNIVCFAADQVPQRGLGEHINFFNRGAYSTTLVQSLAVKTLAPVIYFYIQTNQDNKICINLKQCSDSIYDDSKHKLQINQDIENFINDRPSDYSWEYKRFKRSLGFPKDPYKL
tara:strand:- start:1193 stop:2047 length:855 start_codon:yes stop_codon:yes gene_type:complete